MIYVVEMCFQNAHSVRYVTNISNDASFTLSVQNLNSDQEKTSDFWEIGQAANDLKKFPP
jgi:hypothetical protein